MKRTTYLLDTSVLISDPYCFENFEESDLILHITVLDELDKLKKQQSAAGQSARLAIRKIDEYSDKGDISLGVIINYEKDILLKIDTKNYNTEDFGSSLYGDNRILACAKSLKDLNIVVVSNDINMRVRAKSIGLISQSYTKENKDLDELYSGVLYLENEELASILLENKYLDKTDHNLNLYPNQCVVFTDKSGQEIVKARHFTNGKIKPIKRYNPWDIEARNTEQELLIDLLMDKSLPLVSCSGAAGGGKSIVALACALECVLNKKLFSKISIYRPIVHTGAPLGFMPGVLEEKLFYYFTAIYDNLEILLTPNDEKNSKNKNWKIALEMFQKSGKINMEAFTFIRGRSISNGIIFLDEAQNLSVDEMKTFLTRIGDNTKVFINGDINQIDTKNLDAMNNGLTYIVEKFKNSSLAGHITLKECVRSPLAAEAIKLLSD